MQIRQYGALLLLIEAYLPVFAWGLQRNGNLDAVAEVKDYWTLAVMFGVILCFLADFDFKEWE